MQRGIVGALAVALAEAQSWETIPYPTREGFIASGLYVGLRLAFDHPEYAAALIKDIPEITAASPKIAEFVAAHPIEDIDA